MHSSTPRRLLIVLWFATLCGAGMCALDQPTSWAQEAAGVNVGAGEDPLDLGTPNAPLPLGGSSDDEFKLLELVFQGGVLMVPIMFMSVLVVALVIERFLSLRERKILPRALVHELGQLASRRGGFDPKSAYRICQTYPSSASTVIRAMLLKVGRPQSEVERATAEASDREASRLYSNVRWLNLVASVAPLIGLFGTVWGMIQAFFRTTQLTAGQNKSVFLAEGIYVALVTTLGGLAVAIPAAIFSHYFEGRIQNLFYRIEELLFNLMPQIEKFEGRLRLHQGELGASGRPQSQQAGAPVTTSQSPAATQQQ